jgi:hypothetical protein
MTHHLILFSKQFVARPKCSQKKNKGRVFGACQGKPMRELEEIGWEGKVDLANFFFIYIYFFYVFLYNFFKFLFYLYLD